MARFVRPLAWLFMAFAVAAAAVQLSLRIQAESSSRIVELAADWEEFRDLGLAEGVSPSGLLARLRDAGITSIGLSEITFKQLGEEEGVALLTGGELRDRTLPGAAGGLAAQVRSALGGIDPLSTYVIVPTGSEAGWIARALAARLGADRVRAGAGGFIEIRGSKGDLDDLGLGFRPADLELIRRAGLMVIPRIGNSPHLTDGDIRGLFDGVMAGGTKASVVLFTGKQVLGYPDHIGTTVGEIRNRGLTIGAVETPTQLSNMALSGTEELRRLGEDRMVRVFSLPEWLLTRRTPPEVVDAGVRAAEERNIRVIYLRPMVKGIEPFRQVTENLEHYGKMAAGLRENGFGLGRAGPFPALEVPLLRRVALSLGILAAGVILLDLLVGLAPAPAIALLAGGGIATLLGYLVAPDLGRALFALGAAIGFPALALAAVCRRWGGYGGYVPRAGAAGAAAPGGFAGIWREGVMALLLAVLVSTVGGVLIGALLGDRGYLLEWSFFRGVKLAFILPPLLAGLAFIALVGLDPGGSADTGDTPVTDSGRLPGWRRLVARVRCVGAQPVSLGQLAVLGAVLAGTALYLIRSGNASAGFTPAAELDFRTFLEKYLLARPRTKEFLIGHPVLMMAPFLLLRGNRFGALLAVVMASVGQVSVVNSFSHLRTPFEISILRTFNGAWLGLIFGSLLLAGLWFVCSWWDRKEGAA